MYNNYTLFNFEFDEQKSVSNLAKHGVNFTQAQLLWADPDLLEIPAKTEDEPRYLVVGKIDNKHWAAVITYRQGNVRIISVRRARAEAVALYEG